MASLASVGNSIITIDRERPVSAKRRRPTPAFQFTGNRSRYMPHQGEKERERAARCYMQRGHGYYGPLRSAPCMMQMSKREYERRVDAELIARAG